MNEMGQQQDRFPAPLGLGRLTGVALVLVSILAQGCSPKTYIMGKVGGVFEGVSDSFAADDDPQLVREALPFALKLNEGLLISSPNDLSLLVSACSGFTQYSYAFADLDSFLLQRKDFRRSRELRRRASKLYLRGREYCFRALEVESKGVVEALRLNPEAAVAKLGKKHVDLLYWTAAAWGSAITLGQDDPELTADLPAVRALLERALVLDETFLDGALHEAMVPLEALPPSLGGSAAKAREHFQKAVMLSGGRSAIAYVTLAETLAVSRQDRQEFEALLHQALAIDVEGGPATQASSVGQRGSRRLANILAQQRARELLRRADDLFLSEDVESPVSDPEGTES